MSASRPFFGGDPFCLFKTNDFEYMRLFFFCTFAQQNIFIPFHLRIKYKKRLWNNFRATVCAYLWCERCASIKCWKDDGWFVFMCVSFSVVCMFFFVLLLLLHLPFASCFVLQSYKSTIQYVLWIRVCVYALYSMLALNICILLPRWCLVSCQSIFYNVAFRFHFSKPKKMRCLIPLPWRTYLLANGFSWWNRFSVLTRMLGS